MTSTHTPKNEYVAFSACDIWQQQKRFYGQQGINAWNKKIPYYVTSNPYIANAYAHVCLEFIKESLETSLLDPTYPIYILELGTGPGLFSLYLLRRLMELQHSYGLNDIALKYVMSDMVQENLDFWHANKDIRAYVAADILDFSLYDIEHDSTIKLVHSCIELTPEAARRSTTNPTIVLANYIFDSITQDIFRLKEGQLQELLIRKSPTYDIPPNNLPISLTKIDESIWYREIDNQYYADQNLNVILADYKQEYGDGFISIPTGAVRCLNNLLALFHNNLFVIAGDKADSVHYARSMRSSPEITFHQSAFSMVVNFDAIGRYFQLLGGYFFHQSTKQNLSVSVFTILASGSHNLPRTRLAIGNFLDVSSPSHLYNMYRHILQSAPTCTLDVIISYLQILQWDPRLFNDMFLRIVEIAPNANEIERQDLISALHNVGKNFIYLPETTDTLANIGIVFQRIEEYEVAIEYFMQSLQVYGDVDTTFYNIALCFNALKDYRQAKEFFRNAAKANPNNIMAKGWLTHLVGMDLHVTTT